MKRIVLAIITMGVLAATAHAEAQRPAPPRVRDSAGVRIIEHATIKTNHAAFVIDPKPTLALGGLRDDEREEFNARNPFASAMRLSDGRIVATDYASFKMLDARGRFIRTVGRSGQGPGEFRQLRDVCVLRGDTIVAINYTDGRVSVFDSAGTHLRSFVMAGGGATSGPCLADGIVMITGTRVNPASRMSPERASVLDRVATAVYVGTDGVGRDTIGSFPTEMRQFTIQNIGNVFAQGDALYVGDGRSTDVFVYTRAGRLTRIIRWRDPQTRVTDAMISEMADRTIPSNVTGDERTQRRARARERPMPDYLPAYANILADPAGRVWVQDYFTNPEPRGWTVFAADGALLGRVALPIMAGARGRVDIASIGRDYVVLTWRDEADGALHIGFHALQPR